MKQSLDLMIEGTIKSMAFFKVKENDWRLQFTRNYLNAKGYLIEENEIKDPKYGKGIEIKLIDDEEWIDAEEELTWCRYLCEGINKSEKRFLKTIEKAILNKNKTYHYFTPMEELDKINFTLMYIMTRKYADLEVLYDSGLVIATLKQN